MTRYQLVVEVTVNAEDKVEAQAIVDDALATMAPIAEYRVRTNLRLDPHPAKEQPDPDPARVEREGA